jgi:hypothetical protein
VLLRLRLPRHLRRPCAARSPPPPAANPIRVKLSSFCV